MPAGCQPAIQPITKRRYWQWALWRPFHKLDFSKGAIAGEVGAEGNGCDYFQAGLAGNASTSVK